MFSRFSDTERDRFGRGIADDSGERGRLASLVREFGPVFESGFADVDGGFADDVREERRRTIIKWKSERQWDAGEVIRVKVQPNKKLAHVIDAFITSQLTMYYARRIAPMPGLRLDASARIHPELCWSFLLLLGCFVLIMPQNNSYFAHFI